MNNRYNKQNRLAPSMFVVSKIDCTCFEYSKLKGIQGFLTEFSFLAKHLEWKSIENLEKIGVL
jgi:hypothetical protein